MARSKAQHRKDFGESLRREVERRKGWTGRGAATKLANAVHAKPSLAASWLRGERIPSGTYMARIMSVLGIGAAALEHREMSPGVPPTERTDGDGIVDVASGDTPRPGVVSESFRAPLMEHAERERVRVLADRIARAVQTTVASNELGYTPTTRAHIAASLEAFAKEIEDRCGPGSAGDIWRVIVWLNKQHD